MLTIGRILLVVFIGCVGCWGAEDSCNPENTKRVITLTPRERALAVLAKMTSEEKDQMVHGNGSGPGYVGWIPPITRLGVPGLAMNDGPEGFRGPPGTSTQWPSGMTVAGSWDREMMAKFGDAMGLEFAQKGCDVAFGPGVNLARVPLGGRTFEYLAGEDPFIGSELVVPVVQNLQKHGLIANPKHFIANNQENNRHEDASKMDERTFMEMYFPTFEAAATRGQALSMMCANNRVWIEGYDVDFSCANERALHYFLKTRVGWNGTMLSDYRGTRSTVTAANNGLDIQMPGCERPDDTNPLICDSDSQRPNYFGEPLLQAVANGSVLQSTVDDKVLRTLTSMFAAGVFDRNRTGTPATNVTSPAHNNLARQLAANSAVLMQNLDNILPLSISEFANATGANRLSVIGPAGHDVPIAGGGGSGHVTPAYIITPYMGILAKLSAPSNASVLYYGGTDPTEAAKTASSSKIAIVVLSAMSSEGTDRTTLALDHEELVPAVTEANPNTVVVTIAPGQFLTNWTDSTKALLNMWYPGQEEGNAMADLLFGDVNPSGKLHLTMPNTANDTGILNPAQYPGIDNISYYSEALNVGYRWYHTHKATPRFAFGHGLSYTTFQFANLQIQKLANGSYDVTVTITNTGSVPGAEVAQLYLTYPTSAEEPPQQLKGFDKLYLTPKQSQTAHFLLTSRSFSIWNNSDWEIVHGEYQIEVGAASNDIRVHTTLKI